ncbi:speriolin-like protein isoform X3 [Sceloporus undulatus]|uniref:speriolin-like protein isoform X3 n=1 Tax=Sceloporus undulatus TaxID=8520 RepID=UPI001C4D315D|nr:speriolin-like protein isoform X3 [Sceloporus undulatus]
MTEEREWMKRIQEENVHLKNQIRLLKENYELRLLLGQQCNNSNQVQLSAPHVSSTYPDMGSLLKGAQYTGREHLNYPPHLISKDTTNLSCPSAQTQMKRLHNDPTFFHPRGGEKKATHLSTHYKAGRLLGHSPSWPEELASSRMTNASNKEDILTQASFPDDLKIYKGGSSSRISERQPHHLLSSTQESSKEKTQPEPQEMLRKKRVSFSDEPDSDKLKKFHTFYLNDIELAQNNKRNGRIVGEIAFQLDRRILAHVFPGITRLYGFTVSNIPEKIKQVSMKSLDGSVDEKKYRSMTQRYLDLTTRLEKMGYHKEFHPVFSEFLINTYGILKQRPDLSSNPMHNNPADLRKVVIDIVPSKFLGDTLLLLNCLCELSKEDNKALFAW